MSCIIKKIFDKNQLTNSLSTAVLSLIRLYSWCFTVTTGSLPSNRSKGNNSFKWRRETLVSDGISAARAKKSYTYYMYICIMNVYVKVKAGFFLSYIYFIMFLIQSDWSQYLAVYWNLTSYMEHNKGEILNICHTFVSTLFEPWSTCIIVYTMYKYWVIKQIALQGYLGWEYRLRTCAT